MMNSRILRLGLVLLALTALTASTASADLFSPINPMDIFADSVDVSYTGGVLTATGSASKVTYPDNSYQRLFAPVGTDVPPGFELEVPFDANGQATGGSLVVRARYSFIPTAPVYTLLTGTLHSYQVDWTTGVFEFLFDVTGGDLQSYYAPHPAGVTLNTNFTSPPNAFLSDTYTGDGGGTADVVATPVPPASLLAALGLGALAAAPRVRKLMRRRGRHPGTEPPLDETVSGGC